MITTHARRTDMLALLVAALAAYAVQRLAWPLAPGRDFLNYLTYYLQLGDPQPTRHLLMLFRTPITGIVIGGLLDMGGALLLEAVMALCYSFVIVATYLAGAHWSRAAGILAAGLLVLYPPYSSIFHFVATEALFSTFLIGWLLFTVATLRTPRLWHFALHGGFIALLVLTRPSGQMLLGFVLFPLLLPGLVWWRRSVAALLVLGVAQAVLFGWASYNSIRYDDFTVSRGSAAVVPLYRAFVVDRIVQPSNGPATAELARLVEQELLIQEPYTTYNIDLETFFSSGSTLMWAAPRQPVRPGVGLGERLRPAPRGGY
ncbi:MAG: hypothetical protein HC876_17660 [Chloroflexaceae bacterium]|nr:hypothetical protein [Chloroflexaceae bacterium]